MRRDEMVQVPGYEQVGCNRGMDSGVREVLEDVCPCC